MKRKWYTNEQIAFVLRQAETGTMVEEVCASWAYRRLPSTVGRSSFPAWAWWRSGG